ncbi:MAG TPA: hypothetical protein VNO18_14400, partial [Xanthobacteraceae bacterium]|nr:hypothetical protein [Xanthobacteraceae bacterium]
MLMVIFMVAVIHPVAVRIARQAPPHGHAVAPSLRSAARRRRQSLPRSFPRRLLSLGFPLEQKLTFGASLFPRGRPKIQ